jgi:hypothetical protein
MLYQKHPTDQSGEYASIVRHHHAGLYFERLIELVVREAVRRKRLFLQRILLLAINNYTSPLIPRND